MKTGMNFRLTGNQNGGLTPPTNHLNNGDTTKQTESKMVCLLLLVTFAPFFVLAVNALSMVFDNYKYRNKVSVESVNKTYNVGV
jgi:hypothetical protein